MSNWHYTKGGQSVGPVPFETLRQLALSGELDDSALVWTEGMPQWVAPTEVPGLANTDAPLTAESPVAPAENNPYAAPNAAANLAESSPLDEITPGEARIEIDALLSEGWKRFKENVGIIIGFGVVYTVIMIAVSFVANTIFPSGGGSIDLGMGESFQISENESIGAQLINSLVGVFLTLGATRFLLNICRGENASITDLFSQGSLFLRGILTQLLLYLAFAVIAIPGGVLLYVGLEMVEGSGATILFAILGAAFIIVPFIWLGARIYFSYYTLVDRDLSPVEAIKKSWSITTNNTGNLVGLFIIQGLIAIAGLLALIVGLIVAIPVIYLSTTLAYLWLIHGRQAVDRV